MSEVLLNPEVEHKKTLRYATRARLPGVVCRVSGFRIRGLCVGFQFSVFRFRVSGFGYRFAVQGSGCRVKDAEVEG